MPFGKILGGLFGGGEASRVPEIDPNQVISRQAQVNRVNQITPFGRVNFTGPDRNTLNFTLSPAMQRQFQAQTGLGTGLAQLGQQMLGGIPETGDAATQALLGRLEPRLDLREQQIRETMEQSGNPAAFGSADMAEGAFNELSLFNQERNDARLAALLAGPDYQGALLRNAIGAGQGAPIAVPQFNFQGATPIDVTGPYGLNMRQQQFNAQQANQDRRGVLGGLFDIGSGLLLSGGNPLGGLAGLAGGGGGGFTSTSGLGLGVGSLWP